MGEPLVSNVSDTARWVAVYRAWESARPDALFRDPFAERLAGERGHAIAAIMPRQARNGWPIIVRTRLIDDLVMASIAEGCDCVVNLAAGLDTRPYRMALPASLHWIEVDLPALIEEKTRLLAAEQPVCRLARRAVDLTDAAARAALLDEVAATAKHALVISEGLLLYLEEAVVRALSLDLAARPSIRWWIAELASPGVLRMMRRHMGEQLANAQLRFAAPDGVAYFERLGWQAREIRAVFREAGRLRRLPWFMHLLSHLPGPDPRRLGNAPWSAVVRFGRVAGWPSA